MGFTHVKCEAMQLLYALSKLRVMLVKFASKGVACDLVGGVCDLVGGVYFRTMWNMASYRDTA